MLVSRKRLRGSTKMRDDIYIFIQSTLLKRLQTTYGLNGAVFNWFTSYWSSRLQHVRISTTSSAPSAVPFGVPQGSVLRPILSILHTAD